uniref:Uncharacterized protein n=1 Tax=Tanacetum cinerariifolium TaxID=118510 RepID=A0A6L2NJG0_TANCI|nr:hypothetical protein [Tanacetum cinerariifolium]
MATHLDSGDDSSDEDLSETDESLHTHTALTLAIHPPPTRPLPTSPAFAHPHHHHRIAHRLCMATHLDSGDDSSDEDLCETDESLHTHTALTLAINPPPTRPLPTSPAFAR